MSEMMTAQELAEFRTWLNRRAPHNPDDEEFLPVRVTSLHGLLATVDAEREARERAERERDEARESAESATHRAETQNRRAEAAEALADARGRALRGLVEVLPELKRLQKVPKHNRVYPTSTPERVAFAEVLAVLELTAPEALRQQQELEAERDRLRAELGAGDAVIKKLSFALQEAHIERDAAKHLCEVRGRILDAIQGVIPQLEPIQLAEDYGISKAAVCNIVNGKKRRAVNLEAHQA